MQFRTSILAAALSMAIAGSALACTTVVVGEGASADGSFLIARSADSSAMKAQHMVKHPARTYKKRQHRESGLLRLPLPVVRGI